MPQLNKDTRHPITLTLNGEEVTGHAEPRMLLSDFLTHEIGITSCHVGCEHGVCGACTVLMDGEPVRSCITLAGVSNGSEITTIEGFDDDEPMSQLRQAFHENHALQCGYCTPGMLIATHALLKEDPNPTEEKIRESIGGNLCRCTGYQQIVEAVQLASKKLRETS